MFYEEQNPDSALRFGDVVKGFVLTYSNIESPIVSNTGHEYNVNVSLPEFSVILSPCCSIGSKTIALAPIQHVSLSFFKNPYWEEDLSRINRPMALEHAIPPNVWNSMPEEQKQKRRDEENQGYVLSEYFIYEPNDLLPKYLLKERCVGHYVIDFKSIHRVNCAKILNPTQSPLETKLLQLSIQARSELRTKLSSYFSRVPKEDKI